MFDGTVMHLNPKNATCDAAVPLGAVGMTLKPAVPSGERIRHDLGVTFEGACICFRRGSVQLETPSCSSPRFCRNWGVQSDFFCDLPWIV